MTANRIGVWLVGVLVVIGVLGLPGHFSWAEDAATAAGYLQPVAETPSALPPEPAAPVEAYPNSPVPQTTQTVDGAECEEYDDIPTMPYCSLPGRFWLRADFLMWWTNGMHLPPLVTTSPQGTSLDQAGVLPGATVLFGDQTAANDGRAGFRTVMGMWLDRCHKWDVEFDYFSIGERDANFTATSNGTPILARPLYDVVNAQQGRELVAYPGVVAGTVSVAAGEYFQSSGVTLSYRLCGCDSCESCESGEMCGDGCSACCPPMLFCCRTDLLAGYRYYNLSDRLGIREDLRITQTGPAQDTLFEIHDNFRARNDFHGSELGLRTQLYRGRWSLELLAKVAVGNNHQVVPIGGQTIITDPTGVVQNLEGGVLAVRTNQGIHVADEFTMIPQLGVQFGYQWSCHWRMHVGYDILYWGSVARSADQVDLNVDTRNVPPVENPATVFPQFLDRTSSFWAQGINAGLEVRF